MMDFLISIYFRILNIVEKIGDHRIEGSIGLLTGVFFTLQLNSGNLISAIAIIIIGSGIIELFKKYLGSEPDIVFMTQTQEENTEEFCDKVSKSFADKLKND